MGPILANIGGNILKALTRYVEDVGITFQNRFVEQGQQNELRKKYGLDEE